MPSLKKSLTFYCFILLFQIQMTLISEEKQKDLSPLYQELKGCYNYFMDTTNFNEDSNGYGLTQDRLTDTSLSSIAATGFLIASYPVFVELKYMEYDVAKKIVDKTFDTILNMQSDKTTSYAGCISHFVDKTTGKRYGKSEISTIDTAILISGVISAAQYFKDDLIEKGNKIWSNVDYNKFETTKNGKPYISMGISDLDNPKQLSPWDYYAEQLMIYILGAGNPNPEHRISSKFYKAITKKKGTFNGISHIYSWFGSLFTYQFSHAFFNFKLYNDENGINYYANSVKASKTDFYYCKSLQKNYKTFTTPAWGLTACDIPGGYSGELGTNPRGFGGDSDKYLKIQGTVAPTAAISSMPFTPNESYDALVYYQKNKEICHEKYGLFDSFNFDYEGEQWYDKDFIGIDKGIEVLQLYNYINTDFVSNLAMNNPFVIEGFINNDFIKADRNDRLN